MFNVTTGRDNFQVKRKFIEILEKHRAVLQYLNTYRMQDLAAKIPSFDDDYVSSSSQDLTSYQVQRLQKVEKFLQVVSEMPEVWTRDVLKFY